MRENFLMRWQEKLQGNKLRLTDKQKIVFFKQLAVILNSGVPLLRGLELLQRRADVTVGKVCLVLIGKLKEGTSLATAMQNCGNTFPNLAVTLVAAGERSGELSSVFTEMGDYYSRQLELRQFLLKATLYPLFLLVASISVLCFFLVYVLPMLASVYASLGAQPNEFLQFAVKVNHFLLDYGMEMSLVLGLILLYAYLSRQKLLKLCLRLPLVRSLYAMVLEIRFCKLLGLLLDKGIGITDAVEVATATISQKERVRQLKIFNAALRRGITVSVAVRSANKMFSPLTAELISIGAETGFLPKLLNEAATILEQDLRDRLEKVRELLAPLLLLMAALVIAMVVCSVVGPLFDLFTALPEYN